VSNSIVFIPHGGGPKPLLGDPEHQEMVSSLRGLAERIPRPAAILVISAHWEAKVATVTAGASPSLIYDYYGFPPESYEIQYPCPGEPRLARQVHDALREAGIEAELDEQRGYDHGVFVPLKIMYPEADIPCIQLSLVDSLDAAEHLAIGHALRALSRDDLLVIGSGFSFHNMRAFHAAETVEIRTANHAFETWLEDIVSNKALSEAERERLLKEWAQAPHARFCQPREEHLLPLHVCYGMAGRAADEHHNVNVLNKQSSMFCWHRAVTE